jgi:hypothetical protein
MLQIKRWHGAQKGLYSSKSEKKNKQSRENFGTKSLQNVYKMFTKKFTTSSKKFEKVRKFGQKGQKRS